MTHKTAKHSFFEKKSHLNLVERGKGGGHKTKPIKIKRPHYHRKSFICRTLIHRRKPRLKVFSSSKYLPKNFLPVLSFEVLSFSPKPRPEWLSIELQFRRVRVSNPRPEAAPLFFLVPYCSLLEANEQHLKIYFGSSDKVAMVPGNAHFPFMLPTELKHIFSASNSSYIVLN